MAKSDPKSGAKSGPAALPYDPKYGPPSVIHASLMRSGTWSMAHAYRILGLRSYHAIDHFECPDLGKRDWGIIERAALGRLGLPAPSSKALYTTQAKNKPTPKEGEAEAGEPLKPFTRAEWDELVGSYDALTDVMGFFAEELAEAYPDAKVVVVQRDFDKWWPSFERGCIDSAMAVHDSRFVSWVMNKSEIRSMHAMEAVYMHFFGTNDYEEMKKRAREAYDRYYDRIREVIPPERRLEYKLGDGWEPLCAFLGKEVPDETFPRMNDGDELRARQGKYVKDVAFRIGRKKMSWLLGAPAEEKAVSESK